MAQHYARLCEHTVKTHFEAAISQIDGYLAIDWPIQTELVDNDLQSLELADSV